MLSKLIIALGLECQPVENGSVSFVLPSKIDYLDLAIYQPRVRQNPTNCMRKPVQYTCGICLYDLYTPNPTIELPCNKGHVYHTDSRSYKAFSDYQSSLKVLLGLISRDAFSELLTDFMRKAFEVDLPAQKRSSDISRAMKKIAPELKPRKRTAEKNPGNNIKRDVQDSIEFIKQGALNNFANNLVVSAEMVKENKDELRLSITESDAKDYIINSSYTFTVEELKGITNSINQRCKKLEELFLVKKKKRGADDFDFVKTGILSAPLFPIKGGKHNNMSVTDLLDCSPQENIKSLGKVLKWLDELPNNAREKKYWFCDKEFEYEEVRETCGLISAHAAGSI